MDHRPLIALENVTVRIRDRWLLEGTNWRIGYGENWVIWGANGAGKTTLARVLSGDAAVVQGRVKRHYEQAAALCQGRRGVALVSSEKYHRLYQREQLFDESRHFSGRLGESTVAGELLRSARKRDDGGEAPNDPYWSRVCDALGLSALEEKPVQALSSGEMRKLLIGCALAAAPCLLILDEPFNGLDPSARAALVGLLEALTESNIQMVLIVHRRQEIPAFFSHLLQVAGGRVAWQGTLAEAEALWSPVPSARDEGRRITPSAESEVGGAPLIEMRAVTVRFSGHLVLDRASWTMRAGENWAVVGPNGAGKSTLLKLITGDQLQAYANTVRLFGQPKGSGESVWEIKARIGYVADELQARYQRSVTAFDVICSGFFDSVGLYRQCSDAQRHSAREWVESLGLQALARRSMAQLSFGQQRLVLIARAMVKSPTLLILDEPCNGLDGPNCRCVLHLLDAIVATGRTNLLYVSHRSDEMPTCITHRLELAAGRVVAAHAICRSPCAPAFDD